MLSITVYYNVSYRFLKFHTAYFNVEGILVTTPVKCAINYLRTNFLLDLLCNFPTEIISLAIWNGGQHNENISVTLLIYAYTDNLLPMLSLIRLNRLVRAYKLVRIVDLKTSNILFCQLLGYPF